MFLNLMAKVRKGQRKGQGKGEGVTIGCQRKYVEIEIKLVELILPTGLGTSALAPLIQAVVLCTFHVGLVLWTD